LQGSLIGRLMVRQRNAIS